MGDIDHDEAKKEAILRKLNKRHEDHLAAKEKSKEARLADDESTAALEKLNEAILVLNDKMNAHKLVPPPPNANEILTELSEDMQKLDAFFTEQSVTLTAYDIKKVQESVNDIRSNFVDLQDHLKPKKKFGFKGDKKKAFQKQEQQAKPVSKPSGKHHLETGFNLSDKKNETIVLNEDEINGQDVLLTQLENCTIVIKCNPVTLHMNHLLNCILIAGPVQTSVYMDDCNHCEFSLACQQLRAHNSVDTKIYLHVTSKGIIEDCKDIQVAPYNLSYEGLNGQFAKLGLSLEVNNWNQLDDFNWLASDKASPNWRILPEENRVAKAL